jgi:type IV secretion system protein VirB6
MGNNYFTRFAEFLDGRILSAFTSVVGNALAFVQGPVRGAAVLFVLITGYLVLTGRIDKGILASRVIRIVAVAALLTSAGTFNTVVTQLFMEEIPTAVSSAFSGATYSQPAQQFDAIWNATQRLIASALTQSSGILHVGERIATYTLQGLCFLGLMWVFLIWATARLLMGMVIAFGPIVIAFYLFDATRPFVDRWVGKLMSLTFVQIALSILLQVFLTGFTQYIVEVQRVNAPGAGINELLAGLLVVLAWFWSGALLMAAFGSIAYSIGGSLGSPTSPVPSSIAAATRSGVQAVKAAAARGARA